MALFFIPTANGVDTSHALSQLDNNVQEAISSLLTLAGAPSALQLSDNDWVFGPAADFDPPSPVGPTAESTMPTVALPLPTVTDIKHIPTLTKNIVT